MLFIYLVFIVLTFVLFVFSLFKLGANPQAIILSVSVVFGLVVYMIYYITYGSTNSGFLFAVSPDKQRCTIGYKGLSHHNFEYIPDKDRMTSPSCQNVIDKNRAKYYQAVQQQQQNPRQELQPEQFPDRYLS